MGGNAGAVMRMFRVKVYNTTLEEGPPSRQGNINEENRCFLNRSDMLMRNRVRHVGTSSKAGKSEGGDVD
jgi:hypothetical protein